MSPGKLKRYEWIRIKNKVEAENELEGTEISETASES